MIAVTYARYSHGNKQTDNSIEGQLFEINEYAKENGITIIDNYIDRHISGRKTAGRDAYKALINDIQSPDRRFDTVLVWKVDRISRERDELALFRRLLRQHGVTLISIKEPINDAPEGILLSAVLEGLSEYYSRELSVKVKRGMKTMARKGGSTGGVLPLGYKRDENGSIIVDQEIAPFIHEAFVLKAQKKSSKEILAYLNDNGIKNSKGDKVNGHNLYRILRNEKYKTGDFDFLDVERRVDPIIEEPLFDAAQEVLSTNKPHEKDLFLFYGKAYCSKCGKELKGSWGTGRNGNKFYYYTCPTKGCGNINRDKLEDAVIKTSVDAIFTDDMISYLAKKLVKIDKDRRNNAQELKRLQSELEKIEKSRNNLIKLVEKTGDVDMAADRLKELSSEKRRIERRIEDLTRLSPPLTEKMVEAWLKKFKAKDFGDSEIRKEFTNVFIHKIKADPEGYEICLNVVPASSSTGSEAVRNRLHLVSQEQDNSKQITILKNGIMLGIACNSYVLLSIPKKEYPKKST